MSWQTCNQRAVEVTFLPSLEVRQSRSVRVFVMRLQTVTGASEMLEQHVGCVPEARVHFVVFELNVPDAGEHVGRSGQQHFPLAAFNMPLQQIPIVGPTLLQT